MIDSVHPRGPASASMASARRWSAVNLMSAGRRHAPDALASSAARRRRRSRNRCTIRGPIAGKGTSSCPTEVPAKLLAGAASLIESVELARKSMLLSSKKDDALAIFECDGHPWFISRHLQTPFKNRCR
jgi:hypothetical protein